MKDAADTYQSSEKSWVLPSAEYPRVIRSVYTDVIAAVPSGNGKVVHSRCDGSTFVVRYKATRARGSAVTGTVRGWIGPEDIQSQQSAPKEPHYTVLSIDVCEETDDKR